MPTPAAIISYGSVGSGATELFAGEDRLVTTFASGLVRVDQTYTCPTTAAADARVTLAVGNPMPDGNSDPAIDGVFIYPAPQEKQSGAMTEFIVSAYGRTTADLQEVILNQESKRDYVGSYYLWQFSGSIVVRTATPITIEDLALDPQIYEPFNFTTLVDPTLTQESIVQLQQFSVTPVVQEFPFGNGTVTGVANAGGRRQYRATMSDDSAYTFWIMDPVLTVTASRYFGVFTEIEITSTRGTTTAELI